MGSSGRRRPSYGAEQSPCRAGGGSTPLDRVVYGRIPDHGSIGKDCDPETWRRRGDAGGSKTNGDAAEDSLGWVRDGELVHEGAFRRLIEQVADREQDVPVGAREGAEERELLAHLEVEPPIDERGGRLLVRAQAVHAVVGDDPRARAGDDRL